jgi:hypothetical protein
MKRRTQPAKNSLTKGFLSVNGDRGDNDNYIKTSQLQKGEKASVHTRKGLYRTAVHFVILVTLSQWEVTHA